MNPKHVLLPTDLSDLSLRPVERAPELFAGRKVTLLTVLPSVSVPAPGAPFAPPLEEPDLAQRLEAAREGLEQISAKLPSTADVSIETIGASSSGEAVAEWASANGVDLIALSTHGRTGFRRLALGSVAETVLRHAHVPVICFPPKEDEGR